MEAGFRKLEPGAPITVIAPSSPVGDRESLRAGISILAARYRVRVHDQVRMRRGFLAGPDRARGRSLAEALGDPDNRALMSARGGHGTTRLLARIEWDLWYRSRIPLVGFSDTTALELAALALAGVATVHGPSVTSLAREPMAYREHLFRILEDPATDFEPPPARLRSLRQGRVAGNLVGGNLTMLGALVGTPFMPELAGCVLLIEDVNEAPYRVDRVLTQLRNAGVLDRVAGIVVADFTRCRPRPDGVTVEEVIRDHVDSIKVPAIAGMPAGHGPRNWAFVQGAQVEVRAGRAGSEASIQAGARPQ